MRSLEDTFPTQVSQTTSGNLNMWWDFKDDKRSGDCKNVLGL